MEDRFLEPADDEQVPVVSPEDQLPYLSEYILKRFEDADNGRYSYEQRWLHAYKNVR